MHFGKSADVASKRRTRMKAAGLGESVGLPAYLYMLRDRRAGFATTCGRPFRRVPPQRASSSGEPDGRHKELNLEILFNDLHSSERNYRMRSAPASRSPQFGVQLEQPFRAQWNFVEFDLPFPKVERILDGLGEQRADRDRPPRRRP
jgi:hypothetical protein